MLLVESAFGRPFWWRCIAAAALTTTTTTAFSRYLNEDLSKVSSCQSVFTTTYPAVVVGGTRDMLRLEITAGVRVVVHVAGGESNAYNSARCRP